MKLQWRSANLCAVAMLAACASRPAGPPATATPAERPATAPAEPPVAAAPAVVRYAGTIATPGAEVTFAVELRRGPDGTSGLLHVPAQQILRVELKDVVFEPDRLAFTFAQLGARWTATRGADGSIDECSFAQGNARLPCALAEIDEARYAAILSPPRPQTPKAPFPYDAIEVKYTNPDAKLELSGTLTIPPGDGPHPAVVMITGSGAQDRDETVFGHKPFWVIADHFARHGIATLRVDDRGVGGSGGDPRTATTDDFIGDTLAGLTFLAAQPRIDPRRVGVAGHSEGGLIAPVAAVRSEHVAFVILIGGPGVPGHELVPRQIERLMAAAGAPTAEIGAAVAHEREILRVLMDTPDDQAARQKMRALLTAQSSAAGGAIDVELERLVSPWFRRFLVFDPRPVLRRVKVPVLVLSGTLDLQVDTDQNVPEIEKALRKGGNRRVFTHRLTGLNHLMQRATTGAIAEYEQIAETIAPEVLDLMTRFVTTHAGARRPAKAG